MTTTQEVTADAARKAVDVLANFGRGGSDFQSNLDAATDTIARYITQSSAKIAELTTDRDHWKRQAADVVASNNRLVERSKAAEADNARLREALAKISRMSTVPDDKINRITLMAAHEIARTALSTPEKSWHM